MKRLGHVAGEPSPTAPRAPSVRPRRGLTLLAVALLATACSRSPAPEQGGAANAPRYPEPRFPSYLRPPASVEELLPQIRQIVRNRSGLQGAGMGVLQPGDTIAIVASVTAEDLILEAFKRALSERQVNAQVVYDYELVGVSREDALALRRARQSYTSEHGYMEAASWIETQFPDPEAVKRWLKERRPDLYEALFPPARELSPRLQAVRVKLLGENVGAAIRRYLEKNPGVRGVFWGKGGSTSLRRYLHPLESRFLGLFTLDNRWDAMSAIGTYPGDVWLLAEEKTMEPIVYVDRIHVTDAEGTDVSSQINQIQAERWMRGVYQRGHLYMFPNQATGRFGYSVVDYPAFQSEYLPREPLATIDGVLAGTVNHTGFYPRWEVVFRGGYVREVRGGGVFGDALREMLQYPGINDLVYPFHNPEHPGFWYLYEVAVGTHPKAFRNPAGLEQGSAIPERNRSGVIHWGLGITIHHEPGSPTKSPQLLKFTAEHNLPRDHGFHTHTYFSTYRVHLRNAGRWVTLLDRGRMTSLDDKEVRALASRYGNPDELLTEDWRPEVPGVNAPGDYAQYAANPWKTVQAVIDQVVAGTYPHFFPPVARTTARRAN